ncbi:MAG: translocation/assembly module TamB, partial [Gammaproteobacteria bacterium]
VRLRAEGFEGRLEGAVKVGIESPRRLTGSGEFRIRDGRYQAYGQDLQIDNGRVIFAGGPLDRPSLDLLALRRVGEVVAGVHVTGEPTAPQAELYSRPPMPDQEVLSYVVLGRPLQGSSTAEQNLLLQAAVGLGLKGGQRLAEQLASSFGLDELTLETGATPRETGLRIGKYLSPASMSATAWACWSRSATCA